MPRRARFTPLFAAALAAALCSLSAARVPLTAARSQAGAARALLAEPTLRIVGGQPVPTPRTTTPFFALLIVTYSNGKAFVCGGTLISPTTVLTAAHCLEDTPALPLVAVNVSLGVLNAWDEAEVGAERWSASEWFAHAGYNPGPDKQNLVNDLAIVRLPGRSAFAPAALERPALGGADVGRGVVAMGFGVTWPQGSSSSTDYSVSSPTLNRVRLGIVDGGWCDDQLHFNGALQVCAGSLQGGADTCQGDSGGPLLTLAAGGATGWETGLLVGLVSYGYGCAQPYGPGIYTRLSAYLPWITLAVPDLPPALTSMAPTQALIPAAGTQVCGAAPFGRNLWLDCGALPIGRIVSATWGRKGDGVCAPPPGATPAPASASVAKTATCCEGTLACAAPVSESQFGAVPSGSLSALKSTGYLVMYVRAVCGVAGSWPAQPPPPPAPPPPSPPPRARPASPATVQHWPSGTLMSACAAGAPFASPPPPPPRPPPSPPPLSSAVAVQLTLSGIASLSPALRTNLGNGVQAAVLPSMADADVIMSVNVSDFAVTVTLLISALPAATWAPYRTRLQAALLAAMAKDAGVDPWKATLVSVADPSPASRRRLRSTNTQVVVTLSGFGDDAPAAQAAAAALSYAANIGGTSYTLSAAKRLTGMSTLTLRVTATASSAVVAVGVGIRAGAAGAPSGAVVAARLTAAIADGSLQSSLVAAGVPSTGVVAAVVASGVPTAAPPASGTPGGVAVPAGASLGLGVGAGVGGGILLLCICVFGWRAVRRRRQAQDAAWALQPRVGAVANPLAQPYPQMQMQQMQVQQQQQQQRPQAPPLPTLRVGAVASFAAAERAANPSPAGTPATRTAPQTARWPDRSSTSSMASVDEGEHPVPNEADVPKIPARRERRERTSPPSQRERSPVAALRRREGSPPPLPPARRNSPSRLPLHVAAPPPEPPAGDYGGPA